MTSTNFKRSFPLIAALGLALPGLVLADAARADGSWAEGFRSGSTASRPVQVVKVDHRNDKRDGDRRESRDRDARHDRHDDRRDDYRRDRDHDRDRDRGHGYGYSYGHRWAPAYGYHHRPLPPPAVHRFHPVYGHPAPAYGHDRDGVDLSITYRIHY